MLASEGRQDGEIVRRESVAAVVSSGARRLRRGGFWTSSSNSPGTTARRHPIAEREFGDACGAGGEGLIVLWEASDHMYGKRFKALLPFCCRRSNATPTRTWPPRLRGASASGERRTHRPSAGADTSRNDGSAPTPSFTAGRRAERRSGTHAQRLTDPAPGLVEADLVAHCDHTMAGSFVSTLVLSDIPSGWTECAPLLVREVQLVEALGRLRRALPS